MIEQILREWPPGYGGIERVAHELAVNWGGFVWSFDVQNLSSVETDPFDVPYVRHRLACFRPFGRLVFPIPSKRLWSLITSCRPLHGHLPSPGVLFLLLLARLINPRRKVSAHWHCFLENEGGLNGLLYSFYQRLALFVVPYLSYVVTTSPVLASALIDSGCPPQRVFVLPCCLGQEQESQSLSLPFPDSHPGDPLSVLFIGRLDSYKRLDLLLEALATIVTPWNLVIVGDGPKRSYFCLLYTSPSPRDS